MAMRNETRADKMVAKLLQRNFGAARVKWLAGLSVMATLSILWIALAGVSALAQRAGDPSAPIQVRPFFAPSKPRPTKPARAPIPLTATAPAPAGPAPSVVDGGDTPPTPPSADQPPPYASEMLRLVEILGAVHYLRGLCGADDGPDWRERMQEMIATESSNTKWHARLVANFNRSYRGYARSYRRCTPAAIVVSNKYLKEGAQLTRDIQTRYAN